MPKVPNGSGAPVRGRPTKIWNRAYSRRYREFADQQRPIKRWEK